MISAPSYGPFSGKKSPVRKSQRRPREIYARRLLEGVVYFLLISAIAFDFGHFAGNEVNKLALAKKYAAPDWIPMDWYLAIENTHYEVFNFLMGPLVSNFGFVAAAIVGRLFCYAALAFSFHFLGKSLKLPWYLMAPMIVAFMLDQSLVAGEWVAGGVEAKSIAYATLILGIAAYSRSSFTIGATWLGVALSFHPLIGAYGLLCIAGALAISRSWTPRSLRISLCRQWPFLFSGFWGIVSIVRQLGAESLEADSARAEWIYVYLRNPHHILPEYWADSPVVWVFSLAISALLCVLVVASRKLGRIRFFAAFVLCTQAIFLVGILASLTGDTSILKYFPFRLADSFTPLWLLIFAVWAIARRKALDRVLLGGCGRLSSKWISMTGATCSAMFLSTTIAMDAPDVVKNKVAASRTSSQSFEKPPIHTWINRNTDENAVLLVPPSMFTLYLHAERAAMVTFKHAPHSTSGILEWFSRIQAINAGETPSVGGFQMIAQLDRAFFRLSESNVRQLAQRFGTTHLLTDRSTDYAFTCEYKYDDWMLYRIPRQDSAP